MHIKYCMERRELNSEVHKTVTVAYWNFMVKFHIIICAELNVKCIRNNQTRMADVMMMERIICLQSANGILLHMADNRFYLLIDCAAVAVHGEDNVGVADC